MLYIIIVCSCTLILSAILTLVCEVEFLYALGFTTLAVVAIVALDGLVAGVARMLPKKFADREKKIFHVSAKEKSFYEKLKIRKWKDRVPEIGHLTGFRKNKIADPKSVEYLDRFLLEACYGEIGHFSSCVLGFLILLLFPVSKIWFAISVPVAIINVFLNLPSFFILRYTSYKLEILRKNLLKKQRRADAVGVIEKTPVQETL